LVSFKNHDCHAVVPSFPQHQTILSLMYRFFFVVVVFFTFEKFVYLFTTETSVGE